MKTKDDGVVCGSQVQVDRSGVGHCWVPGGPDELVIGPMPRTVALALTDVAMSSLPLADMANVAHFSISKCSVDIGRTGSIPASVTHLTIEDDVWDLCCVHSDLAQLTVAMSYRFVDARVRLHLHGHAVAKLVCTGALGMSYTVALAGVRNPDKIEVFIDHHKNDAHWTWCRLPQGAAPEGDAEDACFLFSCPSQAQ